MTAASASRKKKPKPKAKRIGPKAEGVISVTRLRNALINAHGSQVRAAEALGCTTGNISARLARNPAIREDVAAALAELDEDTVAQARGNVRDAIAERDMTTTRWLLGVRDPAYAGKTQVTHALDDGNLEELVGAFGGDLGALRKLRSSI